MKLIIHIGTEKTGTSTLQNWFGSNRSLLKKQGIFYPSSLGAANHRAISVFSRDADKPDDGFFEQKIFSIEDHQRFCSDLTSDFQAEFEANSDAKVCLVSGEHMHSRLPTPTMIRRVSDFFLDKFDEIEILVQLRPQLDIAVSWASTASRMRKSVELSRFSGISPNSKYFNYNKLVTNWETVFGKQAVTIIPFNRIPDLTTYLIDRLAIDVSNLDPITRANEALGWRTMALVNATSIPYYNADKSINTNGKLFLDDMPTSNRLSIGIELARRVHEQFDASNQELIRRRDDLVEGDLTPDWRKYQAPSNLDELDTQCVFSEQLTYLVSRFNWELKIERCRTLLAECECALTRRNISNPNMFLSQAEEVLRSVPHNNATEARLDKLAARCQGLAKTIRNRRGLRTMTLLGVLLRKFYLQWTR